MIEEKTIPCITCGEPTTFLGTKLCNGCWEVQTRLQSYLGNENAIQFVLKVLNKVQSTSAESRYGREPDKVKSLAQYLNEYLKYELETSTLIITGRELLEQALDAYESTERVKIEIKKVP